MLGGGGQFVDRGVEDAVELGMQGVGVGLVIDRVQQRSQPRRSSVWPT